MYASEGMIQLKIYAKISFDPLGYGVIRGFNWTTRFKNDPWGKLSMSKDLLS